MAGTKNFQRRIYVCAALAFLCIINYFTYYTLLDYGAFFLGYFGGDKETETTKKYIL